MLQIQLLREQPQFVIDRLAIKNFDANDLISNILNIDNKKRDLQSQLQEIQEFINSSSKEIGKLFASGDQEKANKLKESVSERKSDLKSFEQAVRDVSQELESLIVQLPNIPHDSVPAGKSESDNEVIKEWGTPAKTSGLPHWELAKKYNLIDFELGTKVTGAGFPIYTGKGARLQRALINYFLDKAQHNGYLEVIPPHMVNEESAFGTGQLPDKEGQMYTIPKDGLYMIPTAEVPVTNIFRDTISKEEELPLKRTAYSPCFRREAGSYGKDVRGLNRLHQFDKVEIVQITKPEDSYATLDNMVIHVEEILKELNLPYQILRLCGGDMSFTSALTYDFMVYSSAQDMWLEVSSVSNFEDYQTNRMKVRYKNSDKKNVLAHSLNGSALALPRILASILENNQDESGIAIPTALIPYTGFDRI